jgi:hypothetical protein
VVTERRFRRILPDTGYRSGLVTAMAQDVGRKHISEAGAE